MEALTRTGNAGPAKAALPVAHMVAGLTARELEEALVAANDRTGVGHRLLAFYLHDMQERRLHALLGFASAAHFAASRLDMSRRRARDLIAAGRALQELHDIDEAFAEGRLSWSKTRLLARVATPQTESAWLEHASSLSCRQLEREVAAAKQGAAPRRDRRGLPAVKLRVSFDLDPVAHELWEQAVKKLQAAAGEEIPGSEALRMVAERILRAPSGEEDCAARQTDASLFHLVVQHCSSCRQAALQTDDGPVELDAATAGMVACDAEGVELDKAAAPGKGCGPGVAELPPLPHGTDRPTPAWLRRKILARDGFRCRCCSGREQLMVHHIRFRSEGGRTAPWNLITACSRCHAMVHEGLLRIAGTAPHDLELRDGSGRRLEGRPPRPEGPHRMILRAGDGARAPAGGGGAARELTFEELPAEVDAAWWRANSHLFSWNERRRELVFTPGCSRAPQEEPLQEDRADTTRRLAAHRPASLDAVVGQRGVVQSLRTAVRAAQAEGRPVAHALLAGPPGLGKSSLALAVAEEMGARLHQTGGPAVGDAWTLTGLLARAGEGDVLFIDEIHALPRKVAEMLYEAMEDGTVSMPVCHETRTRTLSLRLAPLTVVGATTDPDRMPAPLLARFGIREELQVYENGELTCILVRAAERAGLTLELRAARRLAGASHGTPREALRLFGRVRDDAVVHVRHRISEGDVIRVLEGMGIDRRGLGPGHRKAIALLKDKGPIGTGRLASMLGMAGRTFRRLHEPVLLRSGQVTPTPRGLAATG